MNIQQNRVWLFTILWATMGGGLAAAGDRPPEPLKSGEYTAELNGLKLWYKVSGSGPVCLMPSPAWGPSSDLYFRTLQSMEKLLTVIYLDSRGTGRSARARSGKEYTWDHLVADLDALRAHLQQDRVWLMGHSEGGVQVLHYAAKYPARVNGLVLLTTYAVEDTSYWDDFKERKDRRKQQPWFADAVKALDTPPKTDMEFAEYMKRALPMFWSDPKKIDAFKDDFAALTFSAKAGAGQVQSKRYGFDLRADLKKVTAPALIVVGDDDFICPPEAATRLHLALPNSKLLLIERCGHFPWLEQRSTFEERVPVFLAALGLQPK